MDYHLKAESETSMWETLKLAGAATTYEVKDEQGNIVETRCIPNSKYNIDIIGTIQKPTGNVIRQEVNGRVVEVQEMETIDGFHANLRGPADLAPKIEYIQYQPTEQELSDPNFAIPEPEQQITPSPLESLLVYPKSPIRTWF